MIKKTILILGKNNILYEYLMDKIPSSKYNITVLTKRNFDIRNPHNFRLKLDTIKPDFIINLMHYNKNKMLDEFIMQNSLTNLFLLQYGLPNLTIINLSYAGIFGKYCKLIPLEEESVANLEYDEVIKPRNEMYFSMYLSELFLNRLYKYSCVKTIYNLRISDMFGSDYNLYNTQSNDIIKKMINNKKVLINDKSEFQPIYAKDVAVAISTLLCQRKFKNNIFNFHATTPTITKGDFVGEIRGFVNSGSKIKSKDEAINCDKLDQGRNLKRIGIDKRPLNDMLKDYFKNELKLIK